MVLITTVTGKQIWVNENQFDAKAETVTYNAHEAGSSYVDKTSGETKQRVKAANEFVGTGKTTKFAVLDYLIAKGVTPTFALG